MKYDTIILIAVRLKSSRLPRKAFSLIEDQTLIEHLIDRMKCVSNAQKVILCTSINDEDTPLIDVAKNKNIEYFCGSEDNVINRFLMAVEDYRPNNIVRVTGDNCLVSVEFLENAINIHNEFKYDYTTTEQLPRGAKGEVISYQALQKLHSLATKPEHSEYMTWFLDNPEFFNICKINVNDSINRPDYRITCDTSDDLKLIRKIYKHLYVKGNIINIQDVVTLLDNNQDLVNINKHIQQISKEDVKNKIIWDLKK